jgi:hypothetical protein
MSTLSPFGGFPSVKPAGTTLRSNAMSASNILRSALCPGDRFGVNLYPCGYRRMFCDWTHLTPCVASDGDLFNVLKPGRASIVTDHIPRSIRCCAYHRCAEIWPILLGSGASTRTLTRRILDTGKSRYENLGRVVVAITEPIHDICDCIDQ